MCKREIGMLYNIVRFYEDDFCENRIIKRKLTLEEAQAHCKDPETSGSTCSDLNKRGQWFDGYSNR